MCRRADYDAHFFAQNAVNERICFILIAVLLLLAACRSERIAQQPHLKLETDRAGLYQVTLAELQRTGFAGDTLLPPNLSLTRHGKQVSYFIDADSLFFYAPSSTSRYHRTQTFLLEYSKGTVMDTAVSSPPTPRQSTPRLQQRYEQNQLYEARAFASVAEPWFWQRIAHGQETMVAIDFPHEPDGNATLRVSFWGLTHNPDVAPDHDMALYLNETFLDRAVWDGQTAYTHTVRLPANVLQHGQNTLRIDNGSKPYDAVDTFFLDDVVIEAEANIDKGQQVMLIGNGTRLPDELWQTRPFLVDITHPLQPTRLLSPVLIEESTILLSYPQAAFSPRVALYQPNKALREPEQGADLLIVVADPAWQPALRPLIARRERQGMRVRVVTFAELTDTFNFGEPHPRALTRFLQHAVTYWPKPAPRFVLLVGDSTLDFNGYANRGGATLPTQLTAVTFGGETVSDALLGQLDAEMGVDIAIGRWPVRTRREVVRLVNKSLAAETVVFSPTPRALIDPSDPGFGTFAQRVNLSTAMDDSSPFLVAYIGHGSLQQWGGAQQHTKLLNNATPPILVQFTCLTGLFAHPTDAALSEQILLDQNQTTHVVAATSLTLSHHQEPFANALLAALTSPNHRHIGTAFLVAQQALNLAQTDQREIHDTFLLFGDPSAPLPLRSHE